MHLRQEEYDQAETQFQAEHEEEVRALRQQKRHVLKQKDDLKKHYQQLLTDQDKQVSRATMLFFSHTANNDYAILLLYNYCSHKRVQTEMQYLDQVDI